MLHKESPSADVLERSQEVSSSNRVDGDGLHNARIDGFDFVLDDSGK